MPQRAATHQCRRVPKRSQPDHEKRAARSSAIWQHAARFCCDWIGTFMATRLDARQAFLRAGWIGVAIAAPILGAPLIYDVLVDGRFDRRLLANVVLMPVFLASVFGFVGFVGWFRHMDRERKNARSKQAAPKPEAGDESQPN